MNTGPALCAQLTAEETRTTKEDAPDQQQLEGSTEQQEKLKREKEEIEEKKNKDWKMKTELIDEKKEKK